MDFDLYRWQLTIIIYLKTKENTHYSRHLLLRYRCMVLLPKISTNSCLKCCNWDIYELKSNYNNLLQSRWKISKAKIIREPVFISIGHWLKFFNVFLSIIRRCHQVVAWTDPSSQMFYFEKKFVIPVVVSWTYEFQIQ